ncbi:hypothetical protein [Kitasatospora sp. NPDC058046]
MPCRHRILGARCAVSTGCDIGTGALRTYPPIVTVLVVITIVRTAPGS